MRSRQFLRDIRLLLPLGGGAVVVILIIGVVLVLTSHQVGTSTAQPSSTTSPSTLPTQHPLNTPTSGPSTPPATDGDVVADCSSSMATNDYEALVARVIAYEEVALAPETKARADSLLAFETPEYAAANPAYVDPNAPTNKSIRLAPASDDAVKCFTGSDGISAYVSITPKMEIVTLTAGKTTSLEATVPSETSIWTHTGPGAPWFLNATT